MRYFSSSRKLVMTDHPWPEWWSYAMSADSELDEWVCSCWDQSCPVTHLPILASAVPVFLSLLLSLGRWFFPSCLLPFYWRDQSISAWSDLWCHKVYLGCQSAREQMCLSYALSKIFSAFFFSTTSRRRLPSCGWPSQLPMSHTHILQLGILVTSWFGSWWLWRYPGSSICLWAV